MKGQFILGMVVGAAAGAVAGLLLAPENGQKNRDALNKFIDDRRSNLNEQFAGLGDKLNQAAENGKTSLQDLQKSAKTVVSDLEQKVKNKTNAVKNA